MPPLESEDGAPGAGEAGMLHVKVVVDFPTTLDHDASEWARKVLPL